MQAKLNEKLIAVSYAVSYLLNLTLLRLPLIMKGRLWSMVKSRCKSKFHLYAVFSTGALLNVMLNVNFALS